MTTTNDIQNASQFPIPNPVNPWDLENQRQALGNIFAHDVAEKMYMQRAAVAMSYGFPPHLATRPDLSPVKEQAPEPPVTKRKIPAWAIALLGTVLGGGIGGVTISQLIGTAETVRETITETVEPAVEVVSEITPPS